jgi:hypothetical protein
MILAHHGGEAPLLQAVLAAAGSASIGLALFRFELSRLGSRLRRGPRDRTHAIRADGAATTSGEER